MTHDYAERSEIGARWVSVETRQVMTSADEELVVNAGRGVEVLDQVVRATPATLQLMRTMSGGASSVPPVPWCWDHEQMVSECRKHGSTCDGELLAGPADPTGVAGTGHDSVEQDRRAMVRLLRQVTLAAQQLDQIQARYAGAALVDESQRPGPGPEHCRSCWVADQLVKEIERKTDGRPYYNGLCRRCGRWRAKLGGGVDLPVWFVKLLVAKEPITPKLERNARDDMRGRRKRGKR
jgi:hypothetical protein